MSTFLFFLKKIGLMLATSQTAQENLDVANCNFGEAYAFNRIECHIGITNRGATPIHIYDIRPVAEEDHSKTLELEIAPGAAGYVPLELYLNTGVGVNKHAFYFKIRENQQQYRALATGFVRSILDSDAKINFGVVLKGELNREEHVSMTSSEQTDFRLKSLMSAPPWIYAVVDADGQSVTVKIRPQDKLGVQSGLVLIGTNSKLQPTVSIRVDADIRGDVIPSVDPIELGLIRKGSNNEFRLLLKSEKRKPVDIAKVEVEGLHASSTVQSCDKEQSCKLVSFVLAEDQPTGVLSGKLSIRFASSSDVLNIPISGWLVDKKFEIKTLTEQDFHKTGGTESASAAVDLGIQIQNAVVQEKQGELPGKGPLLKWSISHGEQIYGFQIFRGPAEQGPFVLVNRETVRREGSESVISTYQYRDVTADSGTAYWYYIGTLYNDGHKERLTSPQRVLAK